MIYLTMRSPPLHFSKWQELVSLLYFYSSPPSRLSVKLPQHEHIASLSQKDMPCADVWQRLCQCHCRLGSGDWRQGLWWHVSCGWVQPYVQFLPLGCDFDV